MNTKQRLTAALTNPIAMGTLSLLLMVGGGWVGDVLKGDCLKFGSMRSCLPDTIDGQGLLLSLVLFVLGAAGLYLVAREYLLVRHLKVSGVSGRRALIATVSTFTPGSDIVDNGAAVVGKMGQVPTTDRICDDIVALADLQTNIQHFLRAVEPHVADVKHIVLIGSSDNANVPPGKPGHEGSARLRERYAQLLRLYVPKANIVIDTNPVNFEHLADMYAAIVRACDKLIADGYAEADIMIDVTGGLKTASIAAALATLHRADIQCQYVSTAAPFNVMAYNMVAESRKRIA